MRFGTNLGLVLTKRHQSADGHNGNDHEQAAIGEAEACMILCAKQVQPISIRTNVQRAVAAKYGLGMNCLS